MRTLNYPQFIDQIEGKGVDYERYALGKLFKSIVKELKIKTVLEIPAKGEKAMPSIYSLAFAEAGCKVSLVDAEENSKWAWKELGLTPKYLSKPEEKYDLVWNFMYLAHDPSYFEKMLKHSKKYVLFVSVNKYNIGFPFHRIVHILNKIPWSHGSVDFMNPFFVRSHFKKNGLKVIKHGLVDCPPWPDSMGFRDMRLHKQNVDLNKLRWDSHTIHWMKDHHYPEKFETYYKIETLPLHYLLKLLYAHLFYVIGEK